MPLAPPPGQESFVPAAAIAPDELAARLDEAIDGAIGARRIVGAVATSLAASGQTQRAEVASLVASVRAA
jgi:hypothetical protein